MMYRYCVDEIHVGHSWGLKGLSQEFRSHWVPYSRHEYYYSIIFLYMKGQFLND